MSFGSNDDNENDLPDWMKDLQSDDENDALENGEDFLSDAEDVPDWLEDDDASSSSAPESPEDDDDVPPWLEKIRDEEKAERPPFSSEPESSSSEDVEEDAWLKNIQAQYQHDQAEDSEEEAEEPFSGSTDEEADEISAVWGEDDEDSGWGPDDRTKDPITQAWEADTGTLVPQEGEEVPDWVSGLPTVEPKTEPIPDTQKPGDEEGEEVPPWLQDIRTKTTEETRPPDDVLPEFGLNPEEMFAESPEDEQVFEDAADEEETKPPAFDRPPSTTGSLLDWMEEMHPSETTEAGEEGAEGEGEGESRVYSEEDVSALFEDDDLPDWLGEEQELAAEEEGSQEPAISEIEDDSTLEKGELPTWLQAMRPVEAVTPDLPEDTAEVDVSEKKKETIGPLSGLSDVLPAEPGIVHFGSKPKPAAVFELTEQQKKYAHLLNTLVENEANYKPVEGRKVANPQQVLRWVIAVLLLSALFAVVWLNGDFLPLPEAGFPEENLAVVSMVNDLQAGDKVLVAFEYQPGLSGEMEAASSALMEHLLLQGTELVLVSTQPVGPGLAESFLQTKFSTSAYVTERQYANLGYVSGGTAGLLNFAVNPRQTVPNVAWSASPLDAVQSVADFAMVLVLTDDPDIARSWIEQVQPLLNGQSIPMVMVTSAQAEPLVYPYYLTEPRQVSGLVSGVSGGAYYETVISHSLARRYWDGYNVGLLLAVLIIAVGSIINLARNPLRGMPEGRS